MHREKCSVVGFALRGIGGLRAFLLEVAKGGGMWERDAVLCVLLAVGVELLCCLVLGEASPGISFPIVLLLFPIAERCAGRCWL